MAILPLMYWFYPLWGVVNIFPLLGCSTLQTVALLSQW